MLTIAASRVNWDLVAVLGALSIGYALSGIPDLADRTIGGWAIIGNIGGWFLVASAACAYYVGFAMLLNSSRKRWVLPLGGQPG